MKGKKTTENQETPKTKVTVGRKRRTQGWVGEIDFIYVCWLGLQMRTREEKYQKNTKITNTKDLKQVR